MDYAVDVKNVSKTFKIEKLRGISGITKSVNANQNLVALDDVSFQIQKGEVLSIIGLNGSGKTTLLRIIAGVYLPDKGSVQVNGSLSPLMQLGAGFQNDLNARENIIMNGMLLGLSKNQIESKIDSVMEYAELEKFTKMQRTTLKKFQNYQTESCY